MILLQQDSTQWWAWQVRENLIPMMSSSLQSKGWWKRGVYLQNYINNSLNYWDHKTIPQLGGFQAVHSHCASSPDATSDCVPSFSSDRCHQKCRQTFCHLAWAWCLYTPAVTKWQQNGEKICRRGHPRLGMSLWEPRKWNKWTGR